MKFLAFLVVLILVALAITVPSSQTITDDDLAFYLEEYPELYNYSEWYITNRVETEFQDHTKIEFAYRYKRTAKTHIAVIHGVSISVDNNFVNNCLDYPNRSDIGEYDCSFITEMGTVEDVESDHTQIIVDKWGVFSRDNLQQNLLSKETYTFLSGLLDIFKSKN